MNLNIIVGNVKVWLVIILFLAGLYFVYTYSTNSLIEAFDVPYNCPNILVEKDGKFLLFNSSKVKIPGINPIQFDTLEEYTEFVDWLRGNGIKCPILYAKQTYTTQGDKSYKLCPSGDVDLCGLPQTQVPTITKLINAGHNKGSMPGFDQHNQNIGDYTPLDVLFKEGETQDKSANPMDANWGGIIYSRSAVARGDYADNEVEVYVDDKDATHS